MTLDAAMIVSAALVLCGAIGVLWRAYSNQVKDLRKDLKDARVQLTDLVDRVRHLETNLLAAKNDLVEAERARRLDSERHSQTLLAYVDKWFRLFSDWGSLMSKRPCVRDTDTPQPSSDMHRKTDALFQKTG